MHDFENNIEITEKYKDYDNLRLEAIKEIKILMDKFFTGRIDLESFRMEIDIANKNKRYPLWGFKGLIGQMYFNLLCKLSENKKELSNLLIKVLKSPNDIGEARGHIDELNRYIKTNAESLPDKRKAPNQKSTLFFLSYFWQIQGPDKYPIFYPSLEKTFLALGILEQNDSLSSYYENFYITNNELRGLFQEELNKPINFWQVEHVFLEYYEKAYKNGDMGIGEGKMGEDSLNKLLESKKQVILYGPPGTGKTFKTKQYATQFLSKYVEFSIENNNSSEKEVWIFQANPNKFDVIGAMNDKDLTEDVWTVSRYNKKIKKGDIGLIWISGENAGIYAQIDILSNPEMMFEPEESIKHWKSPDHKNIEEMRIRYNYKYKFTDNPILRSDLLKIKELENLEIIKQSQGTNFKVNNEEWETLSKLIEERIK